MGNFNSIALQWSLTLLLGIAYTVQIIRVKYDRIRTSNRLTMIPYYFALLYILITLIMYSCAFLRFMPWTNFEYLIAKILIIIPIFCD